MRNSVLVLMFCFSILFLISCKQNKEKVISRENIEKEVGLILQDESLAEVDKLFLESLIHLSKGRKAYLNWMSKQAVGLDINDLNDMIVNEEDFEFIVEKIFKLFSGNNTQFEALTLELIESNDLYVQYASKLNQVYLEIDSVCRVLHHESDSKQEYSYSLPASRDGYCPYMPDNHPLYIKTYTLQSERDLLIEQKFPTITNVRRLEAELFKAF